MSHTGAVRRKRRVVHLHIVSRPRARVHDLTARFIQETHHGRVGIRLIDQLRVAAIHLQVVHLPFSKRLGIEHQIAFRAHVASAGLRTVVVVDSQLHSLGMGIVSQPLDSVRETLRIRVQTTVLVTIVSHPTIINVDHLKVKAEKRKIRHNHIPASRRQQDGQSYPQKAAQKYSPSDSSYSPRCNGTAPTASNPRY